MNPSLIVAFLVLLVGSGVQSFSSRPGGRPPGGPGVGGPGPGGPPPPPPGGNSACAEALAPTQEEQAAMQAAVATCLVQQTSSTPDLSALSTCIADELGLLNADGSFNMDALKASLLAKVAGLDIEANTQLGLDNCPAVNAFDVPAYIHCVATYCETGAAP